MQLNIGIKIRELRRRDGRTQEALAEALGVTGQAVSRWESGGSYPDMEMIPAIANYFHVSIDELFGYHDDRSKRIDELVEKINDMNFVNNGVDINIDECIALAREALVEFPGNDKLTLCLASVLFNAGYVRYGEYHLTDEEGYDIYDVERHRGYTEWREAITLYEKLLKTMEMGEPRNRAVRDLLQLYLNIGERNKAAEILNTVPYLYCSRELLKCSAFDGKKRAEACGEAILATMRTCSELMVGSTIVYEENMTAQEKIQCIQGAIALYGLVCTDGNYGYHHYFVARIYTLLSLYLWLNGQHDEAFEALDESLTQFKRFEACCENEEVALTAPPIRLVRQSGIVAKANSDIYPHTSAATLAEDWPWWRVSEYDLVKDEIQADPRWGEWIAKLQG